MESSDALDNMNVVTPSEAMESIKQDIESVTKSASDKISDAVSVTKSASDKISNTISDTISDVTAPPPPKKTGWGIFKYVLIIVILAFLGFNLFSYLGHATTTITDLFRPILSFFGFAVGDTIKQTTDVAAEGVKAATDITAKSVDKSVDVIQAALSGKEEDEKEYSDGEEGNINTSEYKNDSNKSIQELDQDEKKKQIAGAEKALNDSIEKLNKDKLDHVPSPVETTSVSQSSLSNKSGYCLIGEVNGTRTCLKVGQNDTCVSNKIYPSLEICRNPKLRE